MKAMVGVHFVHDIIGVKKLQMCRINVIHFIFVTQAYLNF